LLIALVLAVGQILVEAVTVRVNGVRITCLNFWLAFS